MAANTYTLISSNVLASSAASVTFSSIPATYTDLVLRVSARRAEAGRQDLLIKPNNDTSNNSSTNIQGSGAAATSNATSAQSIKIANIIPSTNETASTFCNAEFYMPNYAGTANKPSGTFGVGENNATTAYIVGNAALSQIASAISSIVLSLASGTFNTGSSFYLYGIKNS